MAEQEQPGTTSATTPTPDHGESSYVGSSKLHRRRALITGGDSGIGRAVAIAFAREGADVAIVYLPEEQEDARATADHVEAAGRAAVGDLADVAEILEHPHHPAQDRGCDGLAGVRLESDRAGEHHIVGQ